MMSLLFIFILRPLPVYAWDDCPKGLINDPYPGDCAKYIDTDNNGICDHSEPAPEDRVPEARVSDNNVEEVQGISEFSEKTQLAAADTARIPDPSPSNTSQPKPFFAFGIVIFHLAGILIYVTYRKSRLQKGAR